MIVHTVEQRSPEWHKLRMGIPTASEFSKIVTTNGEPSKQAAEYAIRLAAELYIGRPLNMWEGNAWTDRGREMESQAVSLYEFANEVDVARVGFVTDDAQQAGCSPDGLVGDDGMIEVKCLKAENHIAAILRHREDGTCPPEYTQQTQGQLLLCERKFCDLVFYYPELPLLTIRQTARPAIADALRAQIPLLVAERDRVLSVLRAAA